MPPRCQSLLPLVVSPDHPQSWILERLPRRRTGRHPSPDASHVNAVATARKESTGHQSARHREATGVIEHPLI